jgi:signal transduction histidine kinase
MQDAVATRALDPELVLARLHASRWALLRTLTFTRIGVAAAALLFATRPGDGRDGSWWNVAAFALYLAWTVVSGARVRRWLGAVADRPDWLWIEQGACVALVALGGGVRVLSLYLCALPVIFATVFVSPRRGVVLATGDAILVAAILGGAGVFGATPGTEPVHATEWPPALVGLYVAVALFAYVRRLFSELGRTGVAYRSRAQEITEAAAAEARANARIAALADVASRLDGVIPEVRGRLEALRRHRSADEAWQRECAQLERLAEHAQASLDELTTDAPRGHDAATIAAVIAAAVERVASVSGADVRLALSGCEMPVGDAAAAEALARFVEEAVWNAHKHARTPVDVAAGTADGALTLTISDHGDGFRPHRTPRRVGLRSLHRDAELLRGAVTISSARGTPTTVALTVPLSAG